MTLGPDDVYLGVDIGGRSSRDYRRGLISLADVKANDQSMRNRWRVEMERQPGKVHFVQADITEQPLEPNDFFNDVVLNNVVGAGADTRTTRLALLAAKAAVSVGGRIVIHDDWTPVLQDHSMFGAYLRSLGIELDYSQMIDASLRQDPDSYDAVDKQFAFSGIGDRQLGVWPSLYILSRAAMRDMRDPPPQHTRRSWLSRVIQHMGITGRVRRNKSDPPSPRY